jgi:hypothetical protein
MLAYGQSWVPPMSMDMGFDMPTSSFDGPAAVEALVLARPAPQPVNRLVLTQKVLSGLDRRENRRNFHRKVRTGCATCK